MKIIIVSELFDPRKSIGAVRPYNFAIELARMGHTVYCVVSENDCVDDCVESENLKLYYVSNGQIGSSRKSYVNRVSTLAKSNVKQHSTKVRTRSLKLVAWVCRTMAQMWFTLAEDEWYRNAVDVCIQIVKKEKIDVLLTSYGPIANLLSGLQLKKKYSKIMWVSDMRDPVDSMHQQFFWRIWGAHLQRKMLYRADKVVTVCEGITNRYKTMLPDQWQDKVFTIPNGYKEEPIVCSTIEDGILRIGYTGQLYNGTRDMSELFRCISGLEQESGKKLPLEIHYAGGDGNTLVGQAKSYGCEQYIVDYGRLSKFEALRLQEKCDILCVLTWNTKKEQGVLTGKFPEYLRLRKPILAIITGDLENAELSKRIEDLHIGFSYECINSETDYPKMEQWVKECLERKKKNLSLIDYISEIIINEYSYEQLTKQLESLVLKV